MDAKNYIMNLSKSDFDFLTEYEKLSPDNQETIKELIDYLISINKE